MRHGIGTYFQKKLIIVYVCVLIGMVAPQSQAQSIDNVSKLLNNIALTFPTAFHQSSISSIQWVNAQQNTYWGLGFHLALNSNNMFRHITSTEPVGDVFSETSLGVTSYVDIRAKLWEFPIDVGLHLMPLYINQDFYYLNFAADSKLMLYQETGRYIPKIDIGLLYAYSHLYFSYTIEGTNFQGIDQADSDVRIKIEDIKLEARSQVHSIATRIQASKRFDFVTAILGLEPSLIISAFKTHTDSQIKISRDEGKTFEDYTEFSSLAQDFLEEKNLLYDEVRVIPHLNIYTGAQFQVDKVYLDISLGLQPALWYISTSIGLHVLW